MRSTLTTLVLFAAAVGCGKDSEPKSLDPVINEIVASNQTGLEDAGTFPDWAELYNPGDSKVDLSGWFMSDRLDDPGRWKIPKGTSIPAGGYLVVICDSDPEQGPLHTSFDLSITGEELGLFSPERVVIDSVNFGPIATDYAWARMPDEEEMIIVWPPTPGEENRLDPQPPGGAP